MRSFLYFIFFIFISLNLCSVEQVEIKTFFNEDELNKINNNQILSRMYIKYNVRKENSDNEVVIPRTKYFDEDYKIYEIKADEKGFIPYKLTDESKLQFYNLLTSYSKLEGMVYYSRRAKKAEELIKECYRVESLSGNKHTDIVYKEIKPKISNMFKQKDNKFGSIYYKSDLYNDGNNFILVNTSLQPITALVFSINNEEEYKVISYFIYDKEKEGYYYYSFLVMRVRVDMLLKKKDLYSPTTFSNRLRASTVHLANIIGLNWSDKLNAWPGKYDTY